MSTLDELEQAAIEVAKTLTIDDIASAVRFLVKLVGGHDNARDWIAADEAAVQKALDILEEQKIAKETSP